MDPFSAFSLACGIIQIIDFSTEVAKKCRDLYKDGASSENAGVEEMAKHLTHLRTDLDLTERNSPDELLELGSKCSATAQEIIVELQKLKVNEPNRKRKVVGKALKIMLRKGAIEDIRKRLADYQKVLDSRLLVDLRKSSHLLALQQTEGFQDLDLKVQAIIKELAQGPRSFDELKTLIQAENISIKQHITNGLRQHEENLAHKDYRQRFLDSLWYPEIYSRQERVAEAHQATFQWVYEPDGFNNLTRRWYSIVDWFEKDSGIYWISGKAGSGKSTLMNFIHRDDRTSTLLGVWAGGRKVLAPGFFFWNAGTTLERSFQGLLRSLLYQILQKAPDLTPVSIDPILSESQSALAFERVGIQNDEQFAAWTERRLRTTLQSVMRQAKGNFHICIFIDGLDEISGDSEAVIAAVENMQSPDVKVCLSSRPDRSYNEAFHSCAMLRLQDLTEPDIRTYVLDKLQPFLLTEIAVDVSYIMNSLVHKAQGGFLWVELVVKSLIKGLKNKDSLKQLQTRVDSLPSDIEALYAKMLSNIDVAYHKDAAQLLRMALANLTGSVLDTALALHDLSDCASGISVRDALLYSLWTQDRIPDICAGLLEVHLEHKDSEEEGGRITNWNGLLSLPIRYTCSSEAAEVSFQERYAHVEFIHRTAVDFLRQSKQGQNFLETNSQLCPSPHTSFVRALLAKGILLGLPKRPADMNPEFEINGSYAGSTCGDLMNIVAREFVDTIMRNVVLGEVNNGPAQVLLCDDVERTLTIVYQRHQEVYPLSHWSTQWGKRLWDTDNEYVGPFQVRKSSRSSSPDSLYSARSESRLFLTRPFDFVGHAAFYGLSYYVLKKLDLQPKPLHKEYANYLLCCTVWALSHDLIWLRRTNLVPNQLDLVAELLRRGGNPNIYVEDFSTTIWGKFLCNTQWGDRADRSVFVVTTKTFLERGADIQLRKSSIVSYGLRQSQAKSGTEWYPEIRLHRKVSPLYLVRSWLGCTPEMKEVEEIILAKGGHSLDRYTHVAHKRDRYRWYRIPERQHDKLIAALNARCHECSSGNHDLSHCEWGRELGKFYRETVEKDGDSDSRISSDEDFSSSTDAEEEFHDSVTTQIAAEVQDCQLTDE